jgi:RNA polymerase sigma-70 factor, ECF subfamily
MEVVALGEPVGGVAAVMGLAATEDLLLPVASTRRLRLSRASEARFRSMVDAQFDFIWRSVRGLGVPSANADDATQQVFLVAARKLDQIAVGSERAFLFATARGIAANIRRALVRNREVLGPDVLDESRDHAPDPEQLAARNQAAEVLGRILDGFSDDQRTVFVLFELEAMTTVQIAGILGLPMGTVASRLRRAREEFQAATKRFQASRGGRT